MGEVHGEAVVRPAVREALAAALMLAAVAAVYWSPPDPGRMQRAYDYAQLHQHRMRFAREALFGEHRLPAWYPRELLGTPFWSNVQNFPFIPNRLLVVLTLDPAGRYTYSLAVCLAAMLAAGFTYLFSRRIGLGMTASAAGGWTFACCGYFASRVAAGHLPLLEAFCALPLLLWCVESLAQAWEQNRPARRWMAALAASCACMALAGHPQIPLYSMAAAALYAAWRAGRRRLLPAWGAMALGVGCAGFALVPMALLVRRSTRVLALDRAGNDIAMPYRRLLGFFLPWLDGAPEGVGPAATPLFHGYPRASYFWDTICYAGWAPWIAALLLVACWFAARHRLAATRTLVFVAALGAAGIVLALPVLREAVSRIPGTFLRSPARLIYLTEFALAMALAWAVQVLVAGAPGSVARLAVPAVLLFHAADLALFDRHFLRQTPWNLPPESEAVTAAVRSAGDGRIAMDARLLLPSNRTADDVGFFDSVMLARPYRFLLDLNRAPPGANVQTLNGSQLGERVLAAAGVRHVITPLDLPHLALEDATGPVRVYRVASPTPRAAFYDAGRIRYLETDAIREWLRSEEADPANVLALPVEAKPAAWPPDLSDELAAVVYSRPDSDRIECTVTTGKAGYLRIIESWDPGWSATVDGAPAPVVPAMNALIAVAVPPGEHDVRLAYRTPGAGTGAAVSLLSLALLAGWVWGSSRRG